MANQDEEIVQVFEEIFSDPFFADYKEKRVLNVKCQYDILIEDLNQLKKVYVADQLSADLTRYISIDDYYRSDDIIRIQLSCFNKEREYLVQYSTSFRRNSSTNQMELIESVSPFVDTLWTNN